MDDAPGRLALYASYPAAALPALEKTLLKSLSPRARRAAVTAIRAMRDE
jgi:hypothetical protein